MQASCALQACGYAECAAAALRFPLEGGTGGIWKAVAKLLPKANQVPVSGLPDPPSPPHMPRMRTHKGESLIPASSGKGCEQGSLVECKADRAWQDVHACLRAQRSTITSLQCS